MVLWYDSYTDMINEQEMYNMIIIIIIIKVSTTEKNNEECDGSGKLLKKVPIFK